MFYIYVGFLLLMNLLCFLLMGADKSFARKGRWRIPEKVLFGVALFGGSLGGVLGMQLFRHKTKHLSFRIIFPLLLALHIALTVFLFYCGALTLP